MVSTSSLTTRHAVLSVLLAVLLVSAGCNALGVGKTDTGADGGAEPITTTASPTTTAPTDTDTETPTATPAPTPEPDPDATDLREIEVQVVGSDDYTPNTRGEIDRGDPTNEAGHYEPVVFAAQATDTINVTAYSNTGDPKVELRAPNGTTLNINDDGGSGDAAKIENETLPVTGRYTVLVSAGDDSSSETLDYRLTVDRRAYEGELESNGSEKSDESNESEGSNESNESEEDTVQETGWYAGPPSNWNESERYAEWAMDFASDANDFNAETNAEPSFWVNTEQDYVVITLIDGEFYNASQRQGIVGALAYTNVENYEGYVDENTTIVNSSWIPDRTYVRFVTPEERDLYRMNVLTRQSAARGANMSGYGLGPSIDDYFYTIRQGPANPLYGEGEETSIANRDGYFSIETSSEIKPPDSNRSSMNRTTLVNGTLVDVSTRNETGS